MRFALAILLATPGAWAARIGVVRSDDSISDALLLAMELEFPEAEVVSLDADAPLGEDLVATIAVTRTDGGFLVRVVERGAPIAVEREIPAEAGGDEAAAQAVALLARSLLGVALLYEPERTAASPPLRAIAKGPAERASKALVPRSPSPDVPRSRWFAAGAGVAASFGLSPAPVTRLGGAVEVALRPPRFELALEALLLAPADVDPPGAHLTLAGFPLSLAGRLRVPAGSIEIAAGLGLSVERATVDARLDGAPDRSYADWNFAGRLDARVDYAISRTVSIDWSLVFAAATRREDYRWRDALVLSIGSWVAIVATLRYHS